MNQPLTPAPICPWCGSEMFVIYENRLHAFGRCQYACACGAAAPVVCVEYAKPADWNGIENKAYTEAMSRPEQRPLTWDQLSSTNAPVWYDNGLVISPMMVSHQRSWSLENHEIVYGVYHSAGSGMLVAGFGYVELPVKDYGKTWRCWERRPSADDRVAAWKKTKDKECMQNE